MKILFLGYKECRLNKFLNNLFSVVQTEDKINIDSTKGFDYIISFGYKHIIKKDILEVYKNKIINLHISYLPYNKGYHPNFWSFLDNTPKGVTIHIIDRGIDTGDILLQKEINFTKEENTLSITYNKLIKEIQDLFIDNFYSILTGNIEPIPQKGKGTFHYEKDLNKYKHLLTENWDTKTNKL